MEGRLQRYQKLGLRESLSRIYRYPLACKELALIIKLSYSKFPKNLQSLIFQDALTAFRLLPQMQTESAVSAATILLQGAESALPKQKRALAVTEFKRAMVAHKRCGRARQSAEDLAHLPQDIIVHVFSFLDFKSFISALQVCSSWNAASSDNHLWELQFNMLVQALYNFSNFNMDYEWSIKNDKYKCSRDRSNLDGRSLCKEACEVISSKKLMTSPRGLCKRCDAIVWISDMANDTTSKKKCRYHEIKPISTRQIVEYLDDDYDYASSDSNSDSDDESTSKLWRPQSF